MHVVHVPQDVLYGANSVIEPAITPLGDPESANCEILMNVRNTKEVGTVGVSLTKRYRLECTSASDSYSYNEDGDGDGEIDGDGDGGGNGVATRRRGWNSWRYSLSTSSLSSRANGGFHVTNLVDPLLTSGSTAGSLRLRRTGKVLYAGVSDRYFRKGLGIYERVVVEQGTAAKMFRRMATESRKVQYKQRVQVSNKTVMTPTLVELGDGVAEVNSEGKQGTLVGVLYERGGLASEYPLGGIVFQATEIVFESHFIED